ncbi:MAG TPA: phosphoribosylformylglycinamidine cyclo-ligase [Bacillota bacterium]
MKPLDYRGAGVDRDRAARAIAGIARHAARTRRPEQLAGIGGFAGAMALPAGYRDPVLCAAADGVGTKLLLLRRAGRMRTAGIDLVAMNVNDLLACGAEPLFFLDYVAAGRLEPDEVVEAAAGMADACLEAGCTLLGGETAEVPGLLGEGDLELAGFAVGVCERERLLDGRRVSAGDVVIGLASTGPHSNGFSLIRRVLARAGLVDADGRPDAAYVPSGWKGTLLDALLAPTRLYGKALSTLASREPVRAMAHVTGGGLPENLPRVLPRGLGIRLDARAWEAPPVFDWLAGAGGIEPAEMYRTFNMGIGFAVIVPAADADGLRRRLAADLGAPAWIIGEVVRGSGVIGLP